jgi:opacity protein-like surface antigen
MEVHNEGRCKQAPQRQEQIDMSTRIVTMIGATAAALAGTIALAAPAAAQDAAATEQTISTMSFGDWTGLYGGVSLGYGEGKGDIVLGDDINGTTYGVFAGYQRDLGSIVVGGELEWSATEWTDDTIGLDVDSVARAKVRLGYDAGSFLPYAVIGAAQLSTSGAVDDDDTGWFYGAGIDYSLNNGVVLGAEVLQHEFDDYADTGINVSATTITARVAYNF